MFDRPDVSLEFRREADGVVLVDRSRGTGAGYAAAAPLWCVRCEPEGRDLTPRSAAGLPGTPATVTAARVVSPDPPDARTKAAAA
jgi:hypothetical protein